MNGKLLWSIVCCAVAATAILMVATNDADARGGGPKMRPIIYVTGQDLFYDSIVGPNLPPKGPFQLLEMAGPTGLQTEFGPGDPGYVGGRWWVDVNNNQEMDDEDSYFSCPLLGPGRENP
ncbi:MAG: hypothetical protein ACYTF1_21155 [Planctomycetota bacterium]|jgi:hypothetical protein